MDIGARLSMKIGIRFYVMKSIFGMMLFGLLLVGCAIDSSSLNLGTNFYQYAAACKEATMAEPQLVAAEGNLKAYNCADRTQMDRRRYEVFEDDVLVKVFSKPISAAEKQANLNQMLLGLSMIQGATTPTTSLGSTGYTNQAVGFFQYDYVSGHNRLCYYDQVGSTVVKTIGAAEICPLTY